MLDRRSGFSPTALRDALTVVMRDLTQLQESVNVNFSLPYLYIIEASEIKLRQVLIAKITDPIA